MVFFALQRGSSIQSLPYGPPTTARIARFASLGWRWVSVSRLKGLAERNNSKACGFEVTTFFCVKYRRSICPCIAKEWPINVLFSVLGVGVRGLKVFDGRLPQTQPSAAVQVLQPLCAVRVSPGRRRVSALLKRTFDLAAAVAVLILMAPAMVVIALAVTMSSPGPILFRQRRTGKDGRIFHILKFRTMTVVEDGHDIRHAVRGDDRVTPLGAVLRRTSLDELPQLINVLRGDMAIVGPRPHALAHDAHYGALLPRYTERFNVRPGLTGFAQVQGLRGEIRSLECMARRVAADADYAMNWSFRRDLSIIARTVPLLLSRTNAY